MWIVKTKWIIKDASSWIDGPGTFGPFDNLSDANKCVIVIAPRETIVSAIIEEVPTKESTIAMPTQCDTATLLDTAKMAVRFIEENRVWETNDVWEKKIALVRSLKSAIAQAEGKP